jgi:hypothetical protein
MLIAVYKVFVGLLLATFVGVGIAAFAPEPRYPDPPISAVSPRSTDPPPEVQREMEEHQRVVREMRSEIAAYSRNVSAASAIAAIVMMAVSLTVLRGMALFSDGFLLGGVLTFAYSVVRGFSAEDNVFRFIIVSIGLVVALALGYIRFVRQAAPDTLSSAAP